MAASSASTVGRRYGDGARPPPPPLKGDSGSKLGPGRWGSMDDHREQLTLNKKAIAACVQLASLGCDGNDNI